MKKRFLLIFLAVMLCFCAAVPALAAEGFDTEFDRVRDGAGLLTNAQRTALANRLQELRLREHMDVAVITTASLGGKSVRQFADDCYDTCRYGYGSNRDGLLLLISMEDHDWYICTSGYAITVFSDAGIDYIGEQIVPYLFDGNYAAAFDRFTELCDDFITQARTGEPYDRNNLPREPLSGVWIFVALGIGLLAALIAVGVMKGQLRSVRPQTAAANYVQGNGVTLRKSSDLFLYHTVTKIPRPKENSSSGSGIHTSSSGRSHGGGGGKF